MYSVYFVVSEHSLSDRIRSVIDFPRFDLQYFGTEYHSALALRLAIVAKPQIIVLDSDAPFISVSKFVSMLRENDVNCVLILLEGSDARHEPCPGIAAIRLDRNVLSPQRVQDAFRHAIAMADSRSAIRLTVSSPHQMPDDLLAYLQSGGPLTPARLALLFPRTQWVNYYLTVLVFQTPVSDRQLQSFFSSCTARLLFSFYLCRVSETELNYIFQKLDPDSVIRPTPHRVSLAADHDAVRQALERCMARASNEMQTWNPIVIDAVLYACTNYHLKHTQATAAHSVGVSGSYLCAVLKKSLGMTYIDLLTNVRIYHAKRLLAEDPTQRTIRSPPWPGSTTSGISPRFSAALPAARRSNTPHPFPERRSPVRESRLLPFPRSGCAARRAGAGAAPPGRGQAASAMSASVTTISRSTRATTAPGRCQNRSSGMNFPVRSKIWANWPITRASALATPSAALPGYSAAHAGIAAPGWRPIAATQPVSPFWQSTLC